MSQVDFYLLAVDEPHARLSFACRLTEKAWRLGHRVYLHGADETTVAELDDLLWSFSESSFVPHERAAAGADCAVLIGSDAPPATHQDLLVNLAAGVPAFSEGFARVAEIVLNEPAAKAASRERWRVYKGRGDTLAHHDMPSLRSAGAS